MNLKLLLFPVVLVFLATCHGQPNKVESDAAHPVQGKVLDDTVKVLSNNVMVIYQDKKNNYWFGSWQDGLYKFDGKLLVHLGEKDGLPSKRVEEIKEDKHGNIYVNTTQGLYRYDGKSFLKLTESLLNDSDWKFNPDDLWFKSLEYAGYVYRFDGIQLFRLKLPKTETD